MSSKTYRSLTILLGLWLFLWIFVSWPAVQDDAFIHLRYAVNLLRVHMISYDGVHPDYGTSSLLYVWLLAGLREFFRSPVLPRAVSSIFHVALFVGLAWEFPRALRSAPKLAWGFACLLLTILVMPMSVRWLDDGMETSLTLCLIALVAFSLSRLGHSLTLSKRAWAGLFLLGLIATLTRVEYLLLMSVASTTLFLSRSESLKPRGFSARLRIMAACSSPLLGSLLAAGVIYHFMHALVPDTALAKAEPLAPWIYTMRSASDVFLSAMSLGVILLVLWLLTAVAVITYKRRVPFSLLVANSPFPIVLFLAVQRGQEVQGVRYFIWALVFPILWNILELRWGAAEPRPSAARALKFGSYAVVCLLLVALPIESFLLNREFHEREKALAEFRVEHLDRLSDLKLVSFDIGYIGYFSGSPLCDMAGLVNGRARAALRFHDRIKACSLEHPQYAFLSLSSMWELSNYLDLKGWSVCKQYDFANLRAPDVHYLIASPAATAQVCDASGGLARPLKSVFHPGTP